MLTWLKCVNPTNNQITSSLCLRNYSEVAFQYITDALFHCFVGLIQTMQLSVYDMYWHVLLPLLPCLHENKHSGDQEG